MGKVKQHWRKSASGNSSGATVTNPITLLELSRGILNGVKLPRILEGVRTQPLGRREL
jgi:hypothetical protein